MSSNFRRLALISLFLALSTLAVYWPVTGNDFVDYDDNDYVTQNPHVQDGLSGRSFTWVWTSDVARNWHPVTMISHMADYQIYGMKARGHHVTNLLLHVANVVLLFLLLYGLTGAVWRSGFVAALFAFHPLHVESVAWIAERKDVLSTLFFLLTLAAYAKYVRALPSPVKNVKAAGKAKRELPAQPPARGALLHYALALVMFALGLMSKPMLVTTPFVLWLLDFWPLARLKDIKGIPRSIVLDKIPFFALAIASCIVTFEVQQHGGAVLTVSHFSIENRMANALMSYVRYLGKMVWPENLAPLYIKHGAWPLWEAGLAGVALVAVSIIVIRQARSRPYLPAGWFWYLGTLVPVIGIVQVGMQSMADRYTYIPLIGIFIILAWGGWDLAFRWRVPKPVPGVAAGAALVVCVVLTHVQLQYWKNGETLLLRMIAVSEGNYMAHYNLGNRYSRDGRLDDAVREYKAALVAEPNYPEAHNNLGNVLLRQGKFEEAIEHQRAAANLLTEFLYVFNLANALADGGKLPEAVSTYHEALRLNSNSGQAHHNLGLALQSLGQNEQATAEFRAAVQLQPDYESAEFNLANRLADAGKVDEAISHYLVAQQLNPNRAETANGLGICYGMQGKFADAEREFRESIRLKPQNPGAESNLGNALGAQNKLEDAIPHYQKALLMDTNDYQTRFNLGLSYLHQGRTNEAKAQFSEALRVRPDYTNARKALDSLGSPQ